MKQDIHEGNLLKQHLRKEGINYVLVQNKLNISSQSLYYQFRREYLTPKFKHKLASIGITPFYNEGAQDMLADSGYDELKKEIKQLHELVAQQMRYTVEVWESIVPSR